MATSGTDPAQSPPAGPDDLVQAILSARWPDGTLITDLTARTAAIIADLVRAAGFQRQPDAPSLAEHDDHTPLYAVLEWGHTRWTSDHLAVPINVHARTGLGAHALSATCLVCGEAITPTRFGPHLEPGTPSLQQATRALDQLDAEFAARMRAWEFDTDPATANRPPADSPTNAERAAAVLAGASEQPAPEETR